MCTTSASPRPFSPSILLIYIVAPAVQQSSVLNPQSWIIHDLTSSGRGRQVPIKATKLSMPGTLKWTRSQHAKVGSERDRRLAVLLSWC